MAMIDAILNQIVTIASILGATIATAIVAWLVFYYLRYKHRVRIKYSTGGRLVEIDDKARSIKTKEGVRYWKLRKWNTKIPTPPASAIGVTRKGKLSVTCIYNERGEFTYLDYTGTDATKEDALTTTDREFYLNELRLAEQERGKKWTEYVPIIASGLVLIIIFVAVIAFWGDIIAPAKDAVVHLEKTAEHQARITADLKEIILERQQIKNEGGTPAEPPDT